MNERDPQQYPGSQHPGPGAAVAETREKVVTSVEAEAPPASDSGPSDGGQRVREYL